MRWDIRFCIFSTLLLYAILIILMLLLPTYSRGAELPLIQSLPLPEVQGHADIRVRKKHWRLFQPPKHRYEEMQKQGLDPRWRYGPIHYLEIRYNTKPQLKTN